MSEDRELLERYAANESEAAFAELVRRHVDLVHSAALRLVGGDAHRAQDVTQQVFTELARQAKRLTRHPAPVGWLYTTTRHTALRAMRTEQRRVAREQEANLMNELLREPAPQPDWERLRPVLDDVMHELGEQDRLAVLLRYFRNQSLKEVGAALGLNENAARMRVDRALEKMRGFLQRRGVTLSAIALGTVLTGEAVTAAPAGLAAGVCTSALAAAAVGGGTTLTLIKIITMTKLKFAIIGAVAVAGVATPFVIQHQAQVRLRGENDALRLQLDEQSQVAADNQELSNQLADARSNRVLDQAQLDELMRLRSEVGRLRKQSNDLAKLQEQNRRLQTSQAGAAPSLTPLKIQQPGADQTDFPKESWGFAGYTNPPAALETTLWAGSQADGKTILASMSPALQQQLAQRFADVLKQTGMSLEDFLTQSSREHVSSITGFHVLSQEAVADDEILLHLYVTGKEREDTFKMKRIGNDWKMDQFPPDY